MSEEQINELIEYNLDYSIEEDLEETKKCLKEANKEIERLNNQNKSLNEVYELTKEKYKDSQLYIHDFKEEIERLNNIINEVEKHFVFLKMNSTGGNKEFMEDILDYIKSLKELKGEDKE